MRFSKKSQYGLRAMAELALYYDKEPLSARAVSESQVIPLEYLEQIFNRLKKSGLVKTLRGPKGGYILSKAPSKIRAKDIVEALEEKYSVVDSCMTRVFWDRLNKSTEDILASTTLVDLCKRPKAGRNNGVEHNYQFQI